MFDRAPQNNDIRRVMDTCLPGLESRPEFERNVLRQVRGEVKVKKKLSVGFVLVVVIVLAAVTALAMGLTQYFSGFSDLENTYGEYEQWPKSAKVELVQLMVENGVLEENEASQWASGLSNSEKESVADEILAAYFADMVYVDTYNAMVRELGPIEKWSEEERALYTSLLEKHGKLTASWPVYHVPEGSDLTRGEAVARARDAVLAMFSISAEELDSMSIDAIFSEDAYNTCGASIDEPFWIVEFGYGMAYRAFMTRNGEMLGLEGPQTQFFSWGQSAMGDAREAVPSEHDATREEAIQNSRNSLTQVMNVPYEEVDAMDATAHFFYSDLYCYGYEPVWLVSWSKQGEEKWQVLLGYDASPIDVEPAGKLFDQVFRYEPSLADLCYARYEEMGIQNPYTGDESYYSWSLEDKAAFYNAFADFVNQYVSTHPYFRGEGYSEWEWTRNVSSLPTADSISMEQAKSIAESAINAQGKGLVSISDFFVFYYTTNPEQPEWRFANALWGISLDAHTGDVLLLEHNEPENNYELFRFLTRIVSLVDAE